MIGYIFGSKSLNGFQSYDRIYIWKQIFEGGFQSYDRINIWLYFNLYFFVFSENIAWKEALNRLNGLDVISSFLAIPAFEG